MISIERKTYSALEWLGDVGGLFDGLQMLAYALIYPVSSLALRDQVLTQLFHVQE